MAIINNIVTASTGYVHTITSADPVLELGIGGALINSSGYGVYVDRELSIYSIDATINGLIAASASGFWFDENGGNLTVGETGQIRGNSYGVVVFTSSLNQDVVLDNAGVIVGNTAVSTGAANDTVTNSGTIRAIFTEAVTTRDGDDRVVNSGEIIGDVNLGDGNDRFVAKSGGTVDGTVNGGAGDDRYWIVDNDLTLADDGGIDRIFSKVSHTLGADFENLKLLGGKNLDGTGNASANAILGNKGDNKLKGLDGDDTIDGGKGDDKLFGGDGDDVLEGGRGKDAYRGGNGNDTFVFATGSGKDKIVDFDPNSNAEDVDLSKMASITGYSDLVNNHMTQVGGDVVINGGDGDKLTLVGIDLGDLGAGDFLF